MFKKIPELSTDPRLEKEGIRVEIEVPQGDGPPILGWVRVRRAGGNNLLFGMAAKAVQKPFKYQIQHDMLPPGKMRELNRDIVADACVADFGGFPGEDGEEIEYSQANARALLEAYSIVFDIVAQNADEAANFREAQHNVAVEKAKNGSAGS